MLPDMMLATVFPAKAVVVDRASTSHMSLLVMVPRLQHQTVTIKVAEFIRDAAARQG
jgi:hypothetical protein